MWSAEEREEWTVHGPNISAVEPRNRDKDTSIATFSDKMFC